MGNIMYDLADNGLGTENVANSIAAKLKEKYNKDFDIVKIGERYGTRFSNEVTAMCTEKNNNKCIFRAKYNMVKENLICDNYQIRCTCYFIENEINKILRNANAIARAEISKKNELEHIYTVDEFIRRYRNKCFIATLVVEKNTYNNFIKVLNELHRLYKDIKLNLLIYEMNHDEYLRFYEKSKNIDYFSISYIESFQVENKQILKLENGTIKSY